MDPRNFQIFTNALLNCKQHYEVEASAASMLLPTIAQPETRLKRLEDFMDGFLRKAG